MGTQSMIVGIAIGMLAVPVLVGLAKSLKSWPRHTIETAKTITRSIQG